MHCFFGIASEANVLSLGVKKGERNSPLIINHTVCSTIPLAPIEIDFLLRMLVIPLF